MKLCFNGCNLHRQLPYDENIAGNLIDYFDADLEKIEVSYYTSVLLVAKTLILQGAQNARFPINDEIKQIAINEKYTLVLLQNGNLLKISENSLKTLPRLSELDSEDFIAQITVGSKITVALSKSGALFNYPNRLNFNAKDIKQIQAGREHVLLLDSNGRVYSFGRGSRGQLGHGDLNDFEEPKMVEALGGIKIDSIATGGWHSCALSESGDLYTWGWNSNGQLGIVDLTVAAIPTVIDLNFDIRQVACGNRHTIVLSESNQLYGCGSNKYKQLLDDSRQDLKEMTFIYDFTCHVTVDRIKAGPWNSIVELG